MLACAGRGEIHTNGIESLWAIVKRQVYGTHHRMSPQYMPLYLGEISYRFNHRKEPDLFLRILRNAMMTDKQIEATEGAAVATVSQDADEEMPF